ncbi:hypothetical protein BX616_007138, partial [Lobosporangium transversale]
MIMAPVSFPPCQAHSAATATPTTATTATPITGDTLNQQEANLNNKRASIHYPDDSTAAKRMSLHFGPRCRSHSESLAISSTSNNMPESSEKNDALLSSSPSSLSTTLPMSSSSSSLSSSSASLSNNDNQPDKELLKTLTSFLKDEGNTTDNYQDVNNGDSKKSNYDKEVEAEKAMLLESAGPTTGEESTENDLVVTVRDFAYPKVHPYHIGLYPPEPEYEESDYEEDDDNEAEGEEEDRTHGHARGLYDFDAENSTELSFRE